MDTQTTAAGIIMIAHFIAVNAYNVIGMASFGGLATYLYYKLKKQYLK